MKTTYKREKISKRQKFHIALELSDGQPIDIVTIRAALRAWGLIPVQIETRGTVVKL